MRHFRLRETSQTRQDHFLLSVDLRAQPSLSLSIHRLLSVAVHHAKEMWLVNEWDGAASLNAFGAVGARLAAEEIAAPISFPAEEAAVFVQLALHSRHAEVVVDDRLAVTSEDFGQSVTVELFGHAAIEAVMSLGSLRRDEV